MENYLLYKMDTFLVKKTNSIWHRFNSLLLIVIVQITLTKFMDQWFIRVLCLSVYHPLRKVLIQPMVELVQRVSLRHHFVLHEDFQLRRFKR